MLASILVVVTAFYKEIPLSLAGRAVAGSSMSSQLRGTFFRRQEQRGIIQNSYFSRFCRLHGAIQWSGSVTSCRVKSISGMEGKGNPRPVGTDCSVQDSRPWGFYGLSVQAEAFKEPLAVLCLGSGEYFFQ